MKNLIFLSAIFLLFSIEIVVLANSSSSSSDGEAPTFDEGRRRALTQLTQAAPLVSSILPIAHSFDAHEAAVLESSLLDSNQFPQTSSSKPHRRPLTTRRDFDLGRFRLPQVGSSAIIIRPSPLIVSPLIVQLSKLDRIAATQFSLRTGTPELMQNYLKKLNEKCTAIGSALGTHTIKYLNCLIRYKELEVFFKLLIKYQTEPVVEVKQSRAKAFCSVFLNEVSKLESFVSMALLRHRPLPASASIPEYPELESESKKLEREIEAIDFNINFLCNGGAFDSKSFSTIKELLSLYIHLAFI